MVSDELKKNNDGFKYFIGFLKGGIVKPLCIILPEMIRYIKYFETGSKNMSFFIDKMWEEYKKIWDVIKNKLGIKFHSELIHEQKYLKAKVREFDGVIKTNVLGDDMPKEHMHYTCIASITIDSVMRSDKKSSASLIEGCKYRVKKIQISRFINTELKSDSESSDSDSDLDTEKMSKLQKSDSNSESDISHEKN